jgi:hypothetical protein
MDVLTPTRPAEEQTPTSAPHSSVRAGVCYEPLAVGIGDLIDDGPAGAGWLEVFRQGGAFDRFVDSISEFQTPVDEDSCGSVEGHAPKCEGTGGYYRVPESPVADEPGLNHGVLTENSVRHTVCATPGGRGTELRLTADGSNSEYQASPAGISPESLAIFSDEGEVTAPVKDQDSQLSDHPKAAAQLERSSCGAGLRAEDIAPVAKANGVGECETLRQSADSDSGQSGTLGGRALIAASRPNAEREPVRILGDHNPSSVAKAHLYTPQPSAIPSEELGGSQRPAGISQGIPQGAAASEPAPAQAPVEAGGESLRSGSGSPSDLADLGMAVNKIGEGYGA